MLSIFEIFKDQFPYLLEEDLLALHAILSPKRFSKKEVVLSQEMVQSNVVFVVKGMLRGYFLDEEGLEKTVFLTEQNLFIAQPGQVFESQFSQYTIEAIVESEVFLFDKKTLLTLSNTNNRISRLIKDSLFDIIKVLVYRIELQICFSPEKRCLKLLKDFPSLFQNAPNKYLANYLGISPVSFSRILKRVALNKV